MSKKTDAFYFENFSEVASICVKAASYLIEFLTDYNPDLIAERMGTMHGFEHAADLKKHEMSEALSKAFITPIEREDLAELSGNLDEVADNIEEVLQRFYVDEPKQVTKESIMLAERVLACCKALVGLFEELPNYKKPQKLRELVIGISDLEEDCDKIYLEGYRNIKRESSDVLEIVCWRKIYDYLERCADACEHVADSVDKIVMKNS
jgi:predicted phosphate transport protein (TIGR00153 family)